MTRGGAKRTAPAGAPGRALAEGAKETAAAFAPAAAHAFAAGASEETARRLVAGRCLRTSRALVAGLLVALGAGAASAEERYDHRGALGLTLARGGGRKDLLGLGISDSGWRGEVEAGLTFAITRAGSELKVAGRLTLGGQVIDGSALAGFRSYFGYERWKTMLDLDLSVHFTPLFTIGPRLGFGVQYELLSVMGVFAQLGAELGFGRSLRLGFDGMIGVQFRTYVFEGG